MPSLKIFYCGDGAAWAEYVRGRLEKDIHSLSLNLETEDWNNAEKSDFLLVILTPALVDRVVSYEKEFLHVHSVVAAPSRTFGLYCGCDESYTCKVQWDDFDSWTFSSLGSGELPVIDSAVDSIKKFVTSSVQDKSTNNSDVNDNPMARVLQEMLKKKPKIREAVKTDNDSTSSVASASKVGVQSVTAEESTDLQPSRSATSPRSQGKDAQVVSKWGQKSLPPRPPAKPKTLIATCTKNDTDPKPVEEVPPSSITHDKPKPPAKPRKDQYVDTGSKCEQTASPLPQPKYRSHSLPSVKPLTTQLVQKETNKPGGEGRTDAISSAGAKESEKKMTEFRIFPRKVQYNDEILIMLPEPSTEPQLSINIQNRKHDQRDGKSALRVNGYTFSFFFDCVDMSPGELHIAVFEGKKTHLGSAKIQYKSSSDMISEILPTLATPVEMMCDILNLDSANTAALDQHFTRSYYEHSPRQTGPFYNFANGNISERSDKVLPTLLHLSAKFGLMEFAKLLITFPSASLAYRMDNRDGLSPKDIADVEKHADLVKFFENYEIAIMDHETNLIYEDMMTDNTTNSGIPEEDIYLSMHEAYPPKYPVESTLDQQSIYDYHPEPHKVRKCLKVVMKHDEDSNSDEGPNLRIPKDEFAPGRSRSDSVESDGSCYLDMNGLPIKKHFDHEDDDDDDDYIDGELINGKKIGSGTPSDMSDSDTGERDYLSLEAVVGVTPAVQGMQEGGEKKQRPLPPPPPPQPTSVTSQIPRSAQSLLDAPAEEENPYSEQSSSMAELISIQDEFKKGMFSHEQTLSRFEHWKAKFDNGTSKSLKTRMSNLQRFRRYFADKGSKKEVIDITHFKSPKVPQPKNLSRAPEPLPREELRLGRPKPFLKKRSDSSRSVSSASSGSRTSNLSQLSVGDSGNVTENIYSASPASRADSPPPPVPPRNASIPGPPIVRQLPIPPPLLGRPTWPGGQDDDDDEIEGLPPAPAVPPLPPRNY
ncbi:phosphoinositide 3-kinase adapter protein 1-like isoform X2 [Lineus longissimus]|uniref:phosphoinositide 3-kinase adapter protein 1-like isoform X2 n=1 Tax=Lineus longissimus TaxID=88925 RepID=UPI00315DF50A